MLIVPGLGLTVLWLLRVIPAEVRMHRAALATWWVIGTSAWVTAVVLAAREHDPGEAMWAAWGIAAGAAGALLAIDVATKRLPRQISLVAFVAVTALSMLAGGSAGGRVGVLAGAAAMVAVAFVLRTVSRGSLGIGDVLAAPLLGAVVGWFDPWLVMWVWVVAAVSGGVVAAIVARRAGRDHTIAYGPFLIAGVAVALIGHAVS